MKVAQLLRLDQLLAQLPQRAETTHKHQCGHVLVIGGNIGMPGAVWLAAMAAYRVGAGVVTVALHPKHVNGMLSGLPEALVYAIAKPDDLLPLLAQANTVVMGPGLGADTWATDLFQCLFKQAPNSSWAHSILLDASALRLLAKLRVKLPEQHGLWILTPHPGEAAALLNCSTTQIQADRSAAARKLQQLYAGVVVLKGAHTLVMTAVGELFQCDAGNPGMATAGMGDVLSGVIGGLMAQGLGADTAAKLGVMLHAHAADQAVQVAGQRGLMASDVLHFLRHVINFAIYKQP